MAWARCLLFQYGVDSLACSKAIARLLSLHILIVLQVRARTWTKFQVRLILFANGEAWSFVLYGGLIGFIGAGTGDSLIFCAWKSLADDNSVTTYSALIDFISTRCWSRFFVVQDAPLHAEDRLVWNCILSQSLRRSVQSRICNDARCLVNCGRMLPL